MKKQANKEEKPLSLQVELVLLQAQLDGVRQDIKEKEEQVKKWKAQASNAACEEGTRILTEAYNYISIDLDDIFGWGFDPLREICLHVKEKFKITFPFHEEGELDMNDVEFDLLYYNVKWNAHTIGELHELASQTMSLQGYFYEVSAIVASAIAAFRRKREAALFYIDQKKQEVERLKDGMRQARVRALLAGERLDFQEEEGRELYLRCRKKKRLQWIEMSGRSERGKTIDIRAGIKYTDYKLVKARYRSFTVNKVITMKGVRLSTLQRTLNY